MSDAGCALIFYSTASAIWLLTILLGMLVDPLVRAMLVIVRSLQLHAHHS